jgi:dihydropteroate synthase
VKGGELRDTGRGTGEVGQASPASPQRVAQGLPVSLWAVLNVTPDSFSDGGAYLDPRRALAHAERLVEEGADVIDVGGESSRPPGATYGSNPGVPVDEELRRVLPVVAELAKRGMRVSIDTQKAAVAARAIECGASIVNDVSGGQDAELLTHVARYGAEIVLMHNRGRGEREGAQAIYGNVVKDVVAELCKACDRARAAGVAYERIWIDPGIGFAKTSAQSLRLLACTGEVAGLGPRILVGTSRKSFIAEACSALGGPSSGVQDRLGGSIASAAIAVFLGASGIRAHDVAATKQAMTVAYAMREAAQ